MLHEFFKNDIQKDFIQMLIKNTPLPINRCVFDFDRIIKGITYIYNGDIIKCTKTGYINNLDNRAEFNVISRYNNKFTPHMNYFPVCNCGYYDSETHEALGEYLRYYRMAYDINLMQLYNCFSYNLLSGFKITSSYDEKATIPYVVEDSLANVKLLIIPIKFNKVYSLSLECTTGVTILPCLYSNRGFLCKYEKQTSGKSIKVYEGKKYLKIFKPINISSQSTLTPSTFMVDTSILNKEGEPETEDEYNLNVLEKYLNVIIQLPKENNSTVVLLEGDYTNNRKNSPIEFIPDIPRDYSTPILDKMLKSKPALLQMSDGNQYAYSEKLIEYLLENVITKNETITGNIEMVQDLIAKNLVQELPRLYIDANGMLKQQGGSIVSLFTLNTNNPKDHSEIPAQLSYENRGLFDVEYNKLKDTDTNVTVKSYKPNYLGYYKDIWDDKLRFILYNMYMNNSKLSKDDVLGYVDKDMEKYLQTMRG